jgi:integrase
MVSVSPPYPPTQIYPLGSSDLGYSRMKWAPCILWTLSYYVINRVVTRWTKRHLGLRLTPHKLRHAYGRECVNLGVDIRIIAEALGHEFLESTKIYTQVSFQRTRRIAELFGFRRTSAGRFSYFPKGETSRNS